MLRPLLCLLTCAIASGQSFEVASVKPSPPIQPNARVFFGPPRGGPGTPDPGQITWTYANMIYLLTVAYDVKAFQITGPAWITTQRYDIVAKVPAGATKQQLSAMWRNLLAERFGLVVHHEAREFQVEELVVAKGGPKLKVTAGDSDAEPPEGPPQMKDGKLAGPGQISIVFPGGRARTMAIGQHLESLIVMLSTQLNRPVLDKTGLTGRYDFELQYSMRSPPPMPALPSGASAAPTNDTESEPDITVALPQQLGLRLVSAKATLDVIVIDKLAKVPTEN